MIKLPSKESIAIYDYFKTLPGSQHIGKPVSIEALIGICKRINPKRILEMGGGIGAISYTLLKYSDAHIDIYEDNEYCANELKKNLKEFHGRFQIIENYSMLPPHKEYDLAVIDGGNGKEGDGGYSLAARLFLMYIDSIKVVYIEGYRGVQRDLARKALKEKYIYTFTVYKEIFSKGRKWPGGLEIRCVKSNSGILRWGYYTFWEIVNWMRQRYFGLIRIFKNLLR